MNLIRLDRLTRAEASVREYYSRPFSVENATMPINKRRITESKYRPNGAYTMDRRDQPNRVFLP